MFFFLQLHYVDKKYELMDLTGKSSLVECRESKGSIASMWPVVRQVVGF